MSKLACLCRPRGFCVGRRGGHSMSTEYVQFTYAVKAQERYRGIGIGDLVLYKSHHSPPSQKIIKRSFVDNVVKRFKHLANVPSILQRANYLATSQHLLNVPVSRNKKNRSIASRPAQSWLEKVQSVAARAAYKLLEKVQLASKGVTSFKESSERSIKSVSKKLPSSPSHLPPPQK